MVAAETWQLVTIDLSDPNGCWCGWVGCLHAISALWISLPHDWFWNMLKSLTGQWADSRFRGCHTDPFRWLVFGWAAAGWRSPYILPEQHIIVILFIALEWFPVLCISLKHGLTQFLDSKQVQFLSIQIQIFGLLQECPRRMVDIQIGQGSSHLTTQPDDLPTKQILKLSRHYCFLAFVLCWRPTKLLFHRDLLNTALRLDKECWTLNTRHRWIIAQRLYYKP